MFSSRGLGGLEGIGELEARTGGIVIEGESTGEGGRTRCRGDGGDDE
jgi:hypothetical protein